ncbi:MAG: single-stranded DNA-binding protein, partial [Mycobacteriales bacterium]
LRIVASGAPVCSFRIGVTHRQRDRKTGDWVDGESMFLSVSAWRWLGENVHASLHKGDRVVVHGRMRQRTFTTQAGEERMVSEIDADFVGPDLNRHTAVLAKPDRRVPAVPQPEQPQQPHAA